MATTVVMPPSNTVSLAAKYLPLLDEIYQRESLTSFLDTGNAEWIGANAVKLFTWDSVGMAGYDRDGGYVMGDATAGWETFTLNVDRGRAFQVDYVDNEEMLSQAVAAMLSQTERTKIIPEIDALNRRAA